MIIKKMLLASVIIIVFVLFALTDACPATNITAEKPAGFLGASGMDGLPHIPITWLFDRNIGFMKCSIPAGGMILVFILPLSAASAACPIALDK